MSDICENMAQGTFESTLYNAAYYQLPLTDTFGGHFYIFLKILPKVLSSALMPTEYGRYPPVFQEGN